MNKEKFLRKLNEFHYVHVDEGNGTFKERVRKSIESYIEDDFDFFDELVKLNTNLSTSIYDYGIIRHKLIQLIADNVTYLVLRNYGISVQEYRNDSYLEISSSFIGDNEKAAKRGIVQYSQDLINEIGLLA